MNRIEKLRKIATTPPTNLLKNHKFWISQQQFIIRLVISIMVVAGIFIVTYPDSTRPPLDKYIAWLTIFFHCLTAWGIITILKIIAKIKVDHAIADYVDIKATERLREIQNKEKVGIILENIASEILPANEAEEELCMIRIFKQILKEAKDRKFDSSINIMETYREESIGDIFKLQSLQKIALQLGILGTFIGLIMALEKISIGSPGQIVDKLSSALKISFGTSVAGLEVSVILWLFIMLVRRKQEAYFKSMENSTVTMISLARNSINNDFFIAEITDIKKHMKNLGNRIYDQSQKIQKQSQVIQAGLEKLAGAKSNLDEFIRDISLSQIKFVEELKKVYDIFSPTRISNELKRRLDNAVESISEAYKTNLGQASGKLSELNSSLFFLNEVLKNIEKQIKEQSKQIEDGKESAYKAKKEFYESGKRMNESQLKFITDIKELLTTDKIAKLNTELEKFNNFVRKMNRKQSASETNHGIKNEVTKFFSRIFKPSSSKFSKEDELKN